MRTRRTRLGGAVAVAVVLLAAPLAGAGEHTSRATLRDWSARLVVTVDTRAGLEALSRLVLHVERNGRTMLDREIPLPTACEDGGCVIVDPLSLDMLELKDLGRAAPTALLWLWTGGAHCCSVLQTVSIPGGGTVGRNFGNAGAVIVRIAGIPLFLTADDRFSYLYTSYAASGRPLQLLRLRGGRFVDVTPSFPGRIATDAREWWKLVVSVRKSGEDARGVFAAWAADRCRLGHRKVVEQRLAEGVASGLFSPPGVADLGPTGARYAGALIRDLERWGYCGA
jgi:hypothetical protein